MAAELPDEFFGMLCFSEAVDIRRSSPDPFFRVAQVELVSVLSNLVSADDFRIGHRR